MIDFLVSVLSLTIPAGTALLLGTLGEVYAERSGVLNLGVEGMMIMGAITAFGVTFLTKNLLLGILAACVAGGLMALIHAIYPLANKVASEQPGRQSGAGRLVQKLKRALIS